MALIIAGERSGVGKTTVTLTLLSSLSRKYKRVQSFKVGPDYIDPMFHASVTGRPCRNLDPVLTSEAYVQNCFTRHSQGVDFALIEGVMGLFDGASGRDDFASTAHIARLLQLPILLVLDCSRLSRSVAAIAQGYRSFDPRIKIAGVVLNRVGSDRHLELLEDALEPLQLPILGVLRRQDNIKIPDRHLGLVPTDELTQLNVLIDQLAHIGDSCFNWEQLLPLLRETGNWKEFSRSNLQSQNPSVTSVTKSVATRIAVARDRAFSFYYQDNLDILQELGAELVFWSPLTNTSLPENVQGLYFGGGFPEVFAQELADNIRARDAVRRAILTGMPTYAECGGLMYLCDKITDFERYSFSMVGVLPTTAVMGKRLTLGYRQATALQDSPLLSAGATVWGHEFHRSQLTVMPENPLFEIRGYDWRGKVTVEGWRVHQLHASYVHLHWGGCLEIPARFLKLCQEFR
ncbi:MULTISPECIES: cobyrinate a,c-diamide synthase [unclassified Coleofasciculus]|uniref:cobyrinate a,c-diamide synthase n=1 Tax=unclassified Coleofasciculus TaxID=2692782 RepID=UPI00187E8A38|nr:MULTISPECIES: cobyrinate a,c-diamide synthase [unclassified Coleofasciculus]MBE9126677.1 cobyrinate a,c-diamide synthase [Coleofasciculus sp. LEGE 07081]MBE9150771.1 cobyrinate a,c-diamide synthase [Coleofasciculus sp. LEGE 07092]